MTLYDLLAGGATEKVIESLDLKNQLDTIICALIAALDKAIGQSVRSVNTLTDDAHRSLNIINNDVRRSLSIITNDVHDILRWLKMLVIILVVWCALGLIVWLRGALVAIEMLGVLASPLIQRAGVESIWETKPPVQTSNGSAPTTSEPDQWRSQEKKERAKGKGSSEVALTRTTRTRTRIQTWKHSSLYSRKGNASCYDGWRFSWRW